MSLRRLSPTSLQIRAAVRNAPVRQPHNRPDSSPAMERALQRIEAEFSAESMAAIRRQCAERAERLAQAGAL